MSERRNCISLWLLFASICTLIASPESATSHEYPAPTLAESAPVLSLYGGTLTLVLANKNGFVIATDSRSTDPDGNHSDNSQKLFRLGPRSAMAIAGFASNSREPFATDMAEEVTRDLRFFSDVGAARWVMESLGVSLLVLGTISDAEGIPRDRLKLYATVANFDDEGIPQITTVTFEGGEANWHPKVSIVSATTFRCVRFGITDVVDSVIDGTYQGHNRELVRLATVLRSGKQDELSIRHMVKIASTFIRETAKKYDIVGGPTQMGIFEVSRTAIWRQQEFPHPRHSLGTVIFYSGNDTAMIGVAVEGRSVTIVRDSSFTKRREVVDGNMYFGNTFNGCEIETTNRSPVFWRGNHCHESYWIRPGHRSVPVDESCNPIQAGGPGNAPDRK